MDELLKKENIDLSTFVETFGSYNVAKINAYNFLFDETFLNVTHTETVNEMIKSNFEKFNICLGFEFLKKFKCTIKV